MALACVAACERNDPTPPPGPPSTKAVAAEIAAPPVAASSADPATEQAATDSANANKVDREPAVELAVPHTVSVGSSGALTFTISEATIEPRNPESVRLILQIRMHNKQPAPASFADENFRLLTKNSETPANGGLAETIDANTESADQRVQFVVLRGAAPHALKIDAGGEAAEVPLAIKW